jgi:hypothetical protein
MFHVPETLSNTFETITLYQVERVISNLEEALSVERDENIIQDLQNYNTTTLIQSKQEPMISNEPLNLMPLHETKMRSDKGERRVQASKVKKSCGMRHSFYPHWTHELDKLKDFARANAFMEEMVEPEDFLTNIGVYWQQREIVVHCDRNGKINEIRHRSARWFSSTIKRNDDSGDDVRTYLESRAPLDDDETCLETVIDFLEGKSVFTETFIKQIEDHVDNEEFSTKPLINEMFHLNWRFRSMRRKVAMLKFMNNEGDILSLHKIYDGIFRMDTREFEWFPKHFEAEIKMRMDTRTDLELSQKSYEMSLKLFELTKRSD